MSINNLALTSTTQSSAALAISTAVSAMVTSITTNPAWSVANSVSSVGSSSYSYVTLLCSHTYSGLSQDFYVTFSYSGTTLNVILHESFIAAAHSQTWTVTVTGSPTGGTYVLPYNLSGTSTIAYNSTAAAMQTAIQSSAYLGSGQVSVTGSTGGPYTVTLTGTSASAPAYALTLGTNSLTGGTSPSVTITPGTTGNYQCQMTYTNAQLGSQLVPVDSLGRTPATFMGANSTTGALAEFGTYQTMIAPAGYSSFSTITNPLTLTTVYYQVTTYSDHILFGMGTTAAIHPYYYGGFTSVVTNAATNDPYLIGVMSTQPPLTSANQPIWSFTRAPAYQASTSIYNPGGGYYGSPVFSPVQFEYPQAVTSYSQNAGNILDPIAGVYGVSRLLIPQMLTSTSSSASATQYLFMRGMPNNLVVSGALPTGTVIGDTVALNGTYWMYAGTNGTAYFYADTGVAV